jgi:hypothetical protein
MNEIERIEEVMQIVKTKHMMEDMDGDTTRQDRLDYRERFAALKSALKALREKAERSRGCVWCKSDNQVTHNGEHFCLFCSYCGRRLEVEHEDD